MSAPTTEGPSGAPEGSLPTRPASSAGRRVIATLAGADVRIAVLAVVTAVLAGGLILVLTDPTDEPVRRVIAAYTALVVGAFGSPSGLSETLVAATPLVLTGMAVSVPLRAGLFNIGGEGQVLAGGLAGGFVGFAVTGSPRLVHLPLAVAAAVLAGGAIGAVPGILKSRVGAHEVISTIMINNTMRLVTVWVLSTTAFRRPERTDPISKDVLPSARLPRLLDPLRVDSGLIIALVAAVIILWLLDRSTFGFEFRAVGTNADAAIAAGMDAGRSTVAAMSIAGALAGLAGGVIVLGLEGRITTAFSAGMGFDGITVALLGRGGVVGGLAAAVLLGAFKSGGRAMQAATGTALDLVVVVQALIIVLIAAPALVRAMYRVKDDGTTDQPAAKGWSA